MVSPIRRLDISSQSLPSLPFIQTQERILACCWAPFSIHFALHAPSLKTCRQRKQTVVSCVLEASHVKELKILFWGGVDERECSYTEMTQPIRENTCTLGATLRFGVVGWECTHEGISEPFNTDEH